MALKTPLLWKLKKKSWDNPPKKIQERQDRSSCKQSNFHRFQLGKQTWILLSASAPSFSSRPHFTVSYTMDLGLLFEHHIQKKRMFNCSRQPTKLELSLSYLNSILLRVIVTLIISFDKNWTSSKQGTIRKYCFAKYWKFIHRLKS